MKLKQMIVTHEPNAAGQRFLMRIEVPRLEGPAVALECMHCGYAYATAARTAPRRKCPNCQKGEK